jgi:hypothetical protein
MQTTSACFQQRPFIYPILALLGVLCIFAVPALAAQGGTKGKPSPNPTPSGNHRAMVSAGVYNGSATCIQCHSQEANEVMASEHAKWAGKLGKINDFCTYPDTNLLFAFPTATDANAAAGCATCHVSFGPIQPPSNGQMQNQAGKLDCLMCHSDSYNHVGKVVNGTPQITHTYSTDQMKTILAGIKGTPSKEACLKCHAKAGGGDGIKQGDMESTMKAPPHDLDVHMSAIGANFTCVSCHTTSAHKIAGKGADLRVAEGSGMKTCTTCHSGSHPAVNGLGSGDMSEHLAMADCKTCHIPQFARGDFKTEIDRNFANIVLLGDKKEAARVTQFDLTPKYLRYDGTSYFYPLGANLSTTVTEGGVSRYLIAGPNSVAGGSTGGKYHPFKVHTARMAVDVTSTGPRLIPIDSQTLWTDGIIEPAIAGYGSGPDSYVNTVRYLALYHQVAPKEQAYTACNQCHAQVGGGGD